ncbi:MULTISPECIES: CoA ester lyase [Nesterenkonia]|uniref:HpcH/HpaI aldolase/citrate lyase family protein n=1 Tax=Nesterenkonia TaxID=57494 RepID=UPI0011B73D53|nr:MULTISPECIES: CoA ester lyase [Nesterenkonia]
MPIRNRRAAALPAKLSRSWLLINASREDDFAPGLASEADSVIFDLEASVPADGKAAARESVLGALNGGMTAWVRISPTTSEHWEDDVKALSKADGLRGVMLAETERPDQVAYTAMRLRAGTPVIALIESALGVENAVQIASSPGTFRLAFGTNDFRKDVGVSSDPMALAYARSRLVIASRVGGLPGAIDGPAEANASAEAVAEACRVTAEMGMTGKLSLNRTQVEQVNRGLAPSDEELQWAREVIQAHESGAAIGDGSYLPRLARAQKIASLGDSYGLWNA